MWNAASSWVNTLRPRQNGRLFVDDIFKCIFLNENVWIPVKLSLKFVPKGPINNIPALVQIMAWCRQGDKPLSEPMMVSLLTHICATRPQWVKYNMGVGKTLNNTSSIRFSTNPFCWHSLQFDILKWQVTWQYDIIHHPNGSTDAKMYRNRRRNTHVNNSYGLPTG